MIPLDTLIARVRAMTGLLLDPRKPDPDALNARALVDFLRTTPYNPWLDESALESPDDTAIARMVERALKRETARRVECVRRLTPGRARETLKELLLPWDLHDAVTLLRGVHGGRPLEEILGATLPSFHFTDAVMLDLARRSSLREVLRALALSGPPWEAVARAAERFPPGVEDVPRLERVLYQHAYAWPGPRGDPDLDDYLRARVDATNLLLALRLRDQAESAWIAGGTVSLRRVTRQLSTATSVSEAASRLSQLGGVARILHDVASLTEAERTLELALAYKADAWRRLDPLGMGVVAAYLARKKLEVIRLRGLARCVERKVA